MEFTKSLLKGKLIKRYKRFFVDVNLNKEIVTAHCPNTGSMKGLLASKPFIDPVFGQCAVTISLFRFTSTKKRLYLLINLPFNKDLVNSIFELYI